MTQQDMIDKTSSYFSGLRDRLCHLLGSLDGEGQFFTDSWKREEGFSGKSGVLSSGALFEQAGVSYSLVSGNRLPVAASDKRGELANQPFQASGVSLVLHPHNPYVPTTHMNVRFFVTRSPNKEVMWWFGGGFDLTPYYGFEEDARHWHQTALAACLPFGRDVYPRYKSWCDDYFYLPHRNEPRGIGGIFFDDLNSWEFSRCFEFVQEVADGFCAAYLPIVAKRRNSPFGKREREFQLYRRGRYVEFNLLYDRGTLFGLQSGGRAESILMSLPPLVRFSYGFTPESGSEEARLYSDFLIRRDWV